jgi:hypothetical protein
MLIFMHSRLEIEEYSPQRHRGRREDKEEEFTTKETIPEEDEWEGGKQTLKVEEILGAPQNFWPAPGPRVALRIVKGMAHFGHKGGGLKAIHPGFFFKAGVFRGGVANEKKLPHLPCCSLRSPQQAHAKCPPPDTSPPSPFPAAVLSKTKSLPIDWLSDFRRSSRTCLNRAPSSEVL